MSKQTGSRTHFEAAMGQCVKMHSIGSEEASNPLMKNGLKKADKVKNKNFIFT
jgi:hypothetical protein